MLVIFLSPFFLVQYIFIMVVEESQRFHSIFVFVDNVYRTSFVPYVCLDIGCFNEH